MYADDTVLLSESVVGLQKMLDSLHVYSTKWNIDVNIEKTKIVVFRNRGKLTNTEKWTYNGNIIQVVDSFNYLGLTLNYNGKFTKTQKLIALQGKKTMGYILRLCHNLCLNKETQLQVFDTYISSVLNYGCEIWGFVPGHDVENVHMDFCKRILNVKKSTTNAAVLRELGRLPLHVARKVRIVKYWLKLLGTDNCILKALYDDMLENVDSINWLHQVKCLLFELGFGDVWVNQQVVNHFRFINSVKLRLSDHCVQELDTILNNSPKCMLYRHLTDTFCLQYYLRISLPMCYTSLITKFRVSAHQLRIEQGRYYGIERSQRKCIMCNTNNIEDEFHFILTCPLYADIRYKYIKQYYRLRPSVFKLIQLLSVQNRKELCNLGKYLKYALHLRSQLA
jgi:hypothetical protein